MILVMMLGWIALFSLIHGLHVYRQHQSVSEAVESGLEYGVTAYLTGVGVLVLLLIVIALLYSAGIFG